MKRSARRSRRGILLDDNASMMTAKANDSYGEVDDDPRSLRRKSRRRNERLEILLERANAENDPPELSHTFQLPSSSASHSSSIQFRHYTSQLLPTNIFRQCMELFSNNMSDMYVDSHWGLDMHEKEAEMRHENARFIVVLSSSSSSTDSFGAAMVSNNAAMQISPPPPITIAQTIPSNDISDNCNDETLDVLGFIHYRYEYDDDGQPNHPITYLYEIQIHETHQKFGLGSKLLSLLEIMSCRLHMKKVMLTVFRDNLKAISFYNKRGYEIDKCSPSNFASKGEEASVYDYEILSKEL